MSVAIRRLEPRDDRAGFRSGDPDLDRFFHRFAGQNQFRHHIGTTYVAVEDGVILGYVTISVGHIERDRLPARIRRRVPTYPLPVLRVARLAVGDEARGRGVGSQLPRAALLIARELEDGVGCVGIVVDAKATALEWYQKLGFVPLETVEGALRERPEPTPMFLPMGAIPRG